MSRCAAGRTAGFLLAIAWAVAAGCRRTDVLALVSVEPEPGSRALRLNESIRLLFDRPLDPSSILGGGVRILRSDGSAAAGSWIVDGAEAVFVPALPARPDLTDGGYGASGPVRVELDGFPSRSGPLSAEGAPLGAPRRFSYDLVHVTADAPARDLFVDPRPGRGPRLRAPLGLTRRAGEAWVEARFDEPLDPRCLLLEPLALAFDNPDRRRLAVEAKLEQSREGAALRVRPRGGVLAGARYVAWLIPDAVRDLGGLPLDGPLPLRLAFEGTDR